MADEQAGSQAEGQAVPQPADVIRTATAAQAKPAEEDPRAEAAALRARAAEIEAGLPAPEGTTRVKVESPHSEFSFGGVVIGPEYTPVSDLLLPGVQQAADAAGVKLTTEG